MSQAPTVSAGKPKNLNDLSLAAIRIILPVVVINQLFPSFVVEEEEPGKSWKVRIPEGHLHIDGAVFNLLENSEDKRFAGGGAIDAYLVMSGKDRRDKTAFKEAVAALKKQFLPFLDDTKLSYAEKMAKLAAASQDIQVEAQSAGKPRGPRGPVDMPDMSTAERDIAPAREYLIKQRGLPVSLVDDAFDRRAVYPSRGRSFLPGREGPLRLIFPLKNYSTRKIESYSWRSVFGSAKKNQGDKMNAGFLIGPFQPGVTKALFVVESPIEGMSRYTLLREQLRSRPDLLAHCCIVGVNGSGHQFPLLNAAKAFDVTMVFAGYNNDFRGRKFNGELAEDAKSIGLECIEDLVPGGEITVTAYKHPLVGTLLDRWKKSAADINVPIELVTDAPKHETWQVPNRKALCDLEESIRLARIGYHTVESGVSTDDIREARARLVDDFTKVGNPPVLKEREDGSWKVSIQSGEKTQEMLNLWKNSIRNIPTLLENKDAIEMGFLHICGGDYINKDWNDEIKGRTGIRFPAFAAPGLDMVTELERAVSLGKSKNIEVIAPIV